MFTMDLKLVWLGLSQKRVGDTLMLLLLLLLLSLLLPKLLLLLLLIVKLSAIKLKATTTRAPKEKAFRVNICLYQELKVDFEFMFG